MGSSRRAKGNFARPSRSNNVHGVTVKGRRWIGVVVMTIRGYLDEHKRIRDRALFDLAIDSKLRACGLLNVKTGEVVSTDQACNRATVIHQNR